MPAAAWDVSADHEKFSDATEWFLRRTVLTPDEAARLGSEAGRRAFWIGGGLQLSQIQRVFDSIAKAQADGEPFETWRKRVKTELRDDAHAETVFRNATQRSLSAGRYRQMREVEKWRPYFMIDAIMDLRRSTICKRLDPRPAGPPTILPASSPYWATHWSPFHHRCRTGIRSLRKLEAEKFGVSNVPPAVDPDEGFGLSPDAERDWKPDPRKHDPALIAALERKSTRAPKLPPKPKRPPKEHDPKHWEAVYRAPSSLTRDGYGDAAPALGWGRAMLERGLDRTPGDALLELRRLQDAGHPALQSLELKWLEDLPPELPLRSVPVSHTPLGRVLIALQEHTRTIETREFPLQSAHIPAVATAKKWYELMLDKSVARVANVPIRVRAGARAHYNRAERDIELGQERNADDAIHELAHAIEDHDDRALQRSVAFLKARTRDELFKRLSDLEPTIGYADSELAKPDKFVTPYIGKDYENKATEVTSMGYERLAVSYRMTHLMERDPDMLLFLLGQLAGR